MWLRTKSKNFVCKISTENYEKAECVPADLEGTPNDFDRTDVVKRRQELDENSVLEQRKFVDILIPQCEDDCSDQSDSYNMQRV